MARGIAIRVLSRNTPPGKIWTLASGIIPEWFDNPTRRELRLFQNAHNWKIHANPGSVHTTRMLKWQTEPGLLSRAPCAADRLTQLL
jgi:hypothetical protein